MKPLRCAALAAACLALPAQAGEAGILYGKLIGKSQTTTLGKFDDASPTAVGFRVGWSLVDLKAVELSLNGTYQPKSETDLKFNGAKVGRYGVEYLAVGAQLDFKVLVNINVGAEMRQERLNWDLGAGGKADNTQNRPWIRAGFGFTLPTPVLSPFVRLEVAIPVTKEDKTGTGDELRKALAPQAYVGLYGGIRF